MGDLSSWAALQKHLLAARLMHMACVACRHQGPLPPVRSVPEVEECAGQARVLAGTLSALPISPAGTAFPGDLSEETMAQVMPYL